MRVRLLVLTLALLVALTSCGRKGPLYPPQAPASDGQTRPEAEETDSE